MDSTTAAEKDDSPPKAVDEVDKLFLVAMEKFDTKESNQVMVVHDVAIKQELVNSVEAKVVDEMFLAAKGEIDAMEQEEREPANVTVNVEANGVAEEQLDAVADKLSFAAMDKLGFGDSDNEAVDLNCTKKELSLFAKIMEQKELEAEYQLQRPFQLHSSERDINSRKGTIPDVVPSEITLDPSRLHRSPQQQQPQSNRTKLPPSI